jgi:tetratricopeptide (TPR) repeat protein
MKLPIALLLLVGRIAASDEADLNLHVERANAAQKQGEFQKAAQEWEAIAKLRPGIAEALSNAGMMWHFARIYPSAILDFQKALHLNPELTAPRLFLGIDYSLIAAPEKALPQLKQAVAQEPDSPLARKWLAMTYFQAGDFFSASREIASAVVRDPADSELLFWLSRTHLKLLYTSYARIREITPDSIYGRRLREESGPVPETQTSFGAKVRAMIQEKRESDALVYLEGELSRQTADPELWFWIGYTARTLALKELAAFLERAPQSPRVYQLRAEYALAEGKDDAAIEYYGQAVAASPTSVQFHLGIANIEMSRHRYADAVPEYEAELQIDPYSLMALERIGKAYAELGDPVKAGGYLKRALTIDPHASEVHQGLGRVDYDRGDYKAAVAHYLEAVNGPPKPPAAVLFQLSRAYRKLGNTAEADRWLVRFRLELEKEHAGLQSKMPAADKP